MKALDLFAGTGWGVACKWLGIEEDGVEIMPEAIATREANGMSTIYSDVWDGLLHPEQIPAVRNVLDDGFTFADIYELLIASPPCQTFSLAGKGSGRKALDEVLLAITDHLYKDPAELVEFGEKHDPRTALVLAPLAYIWRDLPRFVVLEQVPTVQPVWDAYAVVMREWGYTVETAVLNAEQYGVPQTRRRSILVASLNGPISLPTPTHSKYYSRDPKRLDPGVLPWVSMAEALGWVPSTNGPLFVSNNKRAKSAGWTKSPGGGLPLDRPAPTITAGHDSGNWGLLTTDGEFTIATPEQVPALQSYPSGLVGFPRLSDGAAEIEFGGTAYRARDLRDAELPAQAVTEKARSWKHYTEGGEERITAEQAAALQTYPPRPFVWCGTKTKVFLQIGNAVPPVLAAAVLRSVLDADTKTTTEEK